MRELITLGAVLSICALLCPTSLADENFEAFEISSAITGELPGGKEADGIIGDFVLRNMHLSAVISGDQPNRKANMSTHWKAITPGCLYDLCLRASENDQLTYFGPGALEGAVSYVRKLGKPEDGLLSIVTHRSVETGDGKGQTHRYELAPDWRYVRISSTYTNSSDEEWEIQPRGSWKSLANLATHASIQAGDAMNPPDEQGYARFTVEASDSGPEGKIAPNKLKLAKGKSASFVSYLAPGNSALEAWGILAAIRGPTGTLRAEITERAGGPLTHAALEVALSDKAKLRAYPDDAGKLEVSLPPGEYAISISEIGRPTIEQKVTIEADKNVDVNVAMLPASRIDFEVTAGTESPRKTPCKVQFIGIDGTKDPLLGVDINAHGCRNQYHSENGHFSQQLPPGKYRLVITHGPEFDHVVREVELAPGATRLVKARLNRVVDTSGWISTDFHNHSTPSGDNYCGTDDRVINLAAENIEFAPTTEHNRLYDWAPHIEKLGLTEELSTVVGIELTGPGAHLNAFPLTVVPFRQDNGAPQWHEDPRINALELRHWHSHGGGKPHSHGPGARKRHSHERWVHLNHPAVGKYFRDRDGDGVVDGGYVGLADLIDAAETWSLEILRHEPWYMRDEVWRENRTFCWLQLLNQGTRLWCIAVADAHSIVGNGVGGWRTYVKSSTDEPAKIDSSEIIRNAQAGKMFVTNGPFLDVKLDDGTLPGGTTLGRGRVHIDVSVRCNDWIEIDRVQILVNGRKEPRLNFSRWNSPELFKKGVERFKHRIPVDLYEDAHLIVVAVGERHNLKRGWGNTWESDMHPCAFTNPIYVDVDGKGWESNGDTLDYPLPTAISPIPEPRRESDD